MDQVRRREDEAGRSHASKLLAHGSAPWIGLALVAGMGLRLVFLLRFAHVAGDGLVYGDIAKNLLTRHVYGLTATLQGVPVAPLPTLIRLPGYPLFLAACFRVFGMEAYRAVLYVQLVMDLWTCLLLGGVAARLFGRRAGMAAVWLGALCPFTANYVAAPLTETLTLWCMGLAFYGMARWGEERRWRWVLMLGFALEYALLLRPEQGLLAAAVAPGMGWMTMRRDGWGVRALLPVAVVCAVTLFPLAPWAMRNWRTFHVVQPLAPRLANNPGEEVPVGFQRWYRTWAIEFASSDSFYWLYDGDAVRVSDLPERAFDSPAEYRATTQLIEAYDATNLSSPPVDAGFEELARERIRAHPWRYYVGLPVARVLNMCFRPRADMLPLPVEWWRFRLHWRLSLVALSLGSLNLGYFWLAGAGLTGWMRAGGSRVVVWTMVATVVLRCLLLLTIDNSETRYTLEFFPVLIVLGSAAVARWGGGWGYLPQGPPGMA